MKLTLKEMNGLLNDKFLPSDLIVGETLAEYLVRKFAEADAKFAALAAENAGLKDEISNITFMRDDDFFGSTQRAQEVMGRLVNFKTPDTDAFLAEVRAQGVEMFAAYCGEENSVFVEAKAYYRSLPDAAYEFAAQLRKGVQS